MFAGEEVFNDRASQKAAILAAARAKAAAGAAQPTAPPAAMENSAAQFKSVEGFMDKDVRASQAVRQTEEGEAYGAATFEVTETLAEVAAPEEPEPENVNQGGGLFGMFN
ncbi:hypothetical protein N9L76_06595 [bacterium]|nr:hypothetical protein [bacterium]